MFYDSGMSHYIGGWHFRSMDRDAHNAFVSMLFNPEEWEIFERVEQLYNIVHHKEKRIADKGMRGEELKNFI